MNLNRWAALCACYFLFTAPLAAGTVEIRGDAPGEHVTLTIEKAKVGRVLKEIGKTYGFETAGLEHAGAGDDVTGMLSGSLSDILERLLRNRSHMIIRSADRKGGIKKVMILDASYGAPAPDLRARNRAMWKERRERRRLRAQQRKLKQAAAVAAHR